MLEQTGINDLVNVDHDADKASYFSDVIGRYSHMNNISSMNECFEYLNVKTLSKETICPSGTYFYR